jgi:omega-amidase
MDNSFEGWTEPLGIALVQNSVKLGDPDRTFEGAMALLSQACGEHSPDLVILPESFVSGFDYSDIPGSARVSERVLPLIMEKARERSISMLFSLPFEEGGRTFNRSFWIKEDGSIGGTYDKTHLFSHSGEDRYFSAGSDLRIFNLHGVPVGVLTCYELRYAELARSLAVHGAGVIVYVGEWPASRVHQWDAMLRARAVENQLYAVGVNICKMHGGTLMGGRSAVIEPYGLALASLADSEGFCYAELDRVRLERFREKIPQETDRRSVGQVRSV